MGSISTVIAGFQNRSKAELAAGALSSDDAHVTVGDRTTFGSKLCGIGIPSACVRDYQETIAANGFLVMVHGSLEAMSRAKAVLGAYRPIRIDIHPS